MPSRLVCQDDYIIDGPRRAWITPNFQLSEYAGADGKVHVHRELVAAVQVLRSALGRSVDITSVAPANGLGDGLAGRFVWMQSGAAAEVAVQQGCLDKAHGAIRRRIARENRQSECDLVRISVEKRGHTAQPEWRGDCISRRLCILQREPVPVNEAGRTAERNNPNRYLLRSAPVAGMEKYLS